MKTKIINLVGDINDNLYQLGLSERESFQRLEKRTTRLLSASTLMGQGQDILVRARTILKKRKEEKLSFFDSCLKSYAEGLGIDLAHYLSFLALFEVAAHYGQAFPELKGMLPGCTSLLRKENDEFEHVRLVDFPLVGVLDATPRLYYWKIPGKPAILNYSCEGLAPLFFQALHESGFSLSVHHKPAPDFHQEGKGIFQIVFELLFESQQLADIRRELKKKHSIAKWNLILLEQTGKVEVYDIDGPTLNQEIYHLNESSPLIFTNIPLKHDENSFDGFLHFCRLRQSWLREKLAKKSKDHILDIVTDVKDQRNSKWMHPASTLATTAAICLNLSRGFIDIKEGDGALTASDAIIRYSLADQKDATILKEAKELPDFERAWKKASLAQSAYDQGNYDDAYHELQMAQALIPLETWKHIFDLYLCLWDFRFVKNGKELSHVYKRVQKLELPLLLSDQKNLLSMRLEKKLGLQPTVKKEDISPYLRDHFEQEKNASKPVFAAWMALLYPRLEILDVFSPHLG
jgi:hypothetical protein